MANQPKKRLQQVNLHLLKSSVSSFKQALDPKKSPLSITAISSILPSGMLYYEAPQPNQATWRGFLAPGFGSNLPQFQTQHTSAVLFFKAAHGKMKRTFAVTFGYGRSLLSEASLEPDFGLRSALQLCDPATLRAVDYRTIEERTRIGRVQLGESGSVDAFRMNYDTDLLRGLEASSKDKSICEKLGAKWSNLIVSARVEVNDLPRLAADLLREYRRRQLPSEYAWIENVQRVTDPSKVSALNAELEARVNQGQFEGLRLALPEIVENSASAEVKLFQPSLDANDFTSDFSEYLTLRPRQNTTWRVSTARNSHSVFIVDTSTGNEREHYSVHRCLIAEIDFQGERFQLVDGEWFRLDRDFVNEIDSAISKIPLLSHQLPGWKPGEREEAWNIRACKSWPDAALLDKTNISHGGGRSKIEPADILTKGKVLLHAKRRERSSQGLSHLFAQGVVSSRLLSRDKSFRTKVKAAIPRSHKTFGNGLGDSFDARKWTTGYVILGADPTKPAESLPFFSKINLRGAAEQLQLFGFRVGVIGT